MKIFVLTICALFFSGTTFTPPQRTDDSEVQLWITCENEDLKNALIQAVVVFEKKYDIKGAIIVSKGDPPNKDTWRLFARQAPIQRNVMLYNKEDDKEYLNLGSKELRYILDFLEFVFEINEHKLVTVDMAAAKTPVYK